jgi:hypothetical protein
MAATYYGEPTFTEDLDLFVCFQDEEQTVLDLSPVYKFLATLGYRAKGEGVLIEGILVQFLPAYDELIKEAVDQALPVRYGKTKTGFVSLEHFIAIMLDNFRPKDQLRLLSLLELDGDVKSKIKINKSKLADILKRHEIERTWDGFAKKK